MNEATPLKLVARDADDLAVIAACVQDALVPIGEMAFLPAEGRFILALNRFRWDRPNADADTAIDVRDAAAHGDAEFWLTGDSGPSFERVHSALRFEQVTAVRTRGIDLKKRDRILELLTIHLEPNTVLMVFAGDAMIRVEMTGLLCYLEDFGAGWPTRWKPRHPEDSSGPTEK